MRAFLRSVDFPGSFCHSIQAVLDDLRGQPSESKTVFIMHLIKCIDILKWHVQFVCLLKAVSVKTLSCEPDVPAAPKMGSRTKTSLTLFWNVRLLPPSIAGIVPLFHFIIFHRLFQIMDRN